MKLKLLILILSDESDIATCDETSTDLILFNTRPLLLKQHSQQRIQCMWRECAVKVNLKRTCSNCKYAVNMIVKRIYCECPVNQNVQRMFSESEGHKQRMCSEDKANVRVHVLPAANAERVLM